ncbi:aminotransferase class III-fold pyridoxal phosphate-dependent enzyme [Saccharopolyspora sp. K220]|uniref:aminotransferase family protein n=1 Tax=Saccharopolyspora soli TaxID=2926618 RepID=UPI001F59D15B|nr:aminotransferase class III-fold pyridoxal phosphate-dependent enzyme [Saccharopolyspora soli]MCI2417368.1 aminotransferase class III-fold pyridoxal phosphate-dependent enzyme [Saccharopolyspora soli]
MGSYWHPFADMASIADTGELVIDSGEGAYVVDESGRRYFDAAGGLWYCSVGYGRAEIAEAAAAQMRRMSAYSNFGDFATRPTLDLAERVAALAPVPDAKVFFTSGGSDSVDTAVKLSLRYWAERGEPDRNVIIVREHAYHGMHVGGTGLAGIPDNRTGYPELLPSVVRVAYDSAEELDAEIQRIGPNRVAAFFCEPVIGAGGVRPVPQSYLTAAREVCRRTGVLFVADEVICGFGRLGEWFASTRFALEPDIITCAKGLTSGYLPMGAVIVSGAVAEPFFTRRGVLWRHGYTYSGHATAAAVALANLDILEREGLVGRVGELEQQLTRSLAPLAGHRLVNEVRSGVGLLAAIELDPAAVQAKPGLPSQIIAELRERGVVTRFLAGSALQVSPAFVTDEADLKILATAAVEALDAAASQL